MSCFVVTLYFSYLQELGFDYLRDNLAGSRGQLVMRWCVLCFLMRTSRFILFVLFGI